MTDAHADTPPDGPAASAAATPGPRIRWAAVVWGLTFAAVAAAGYAVASSAPATDTLTDALASAEPGAAIAVLLLMVGVLVMVGAIAGVLRAGQRALTRRRIHQTTPESSRQT
ncbi:hypothetical protein ACIGEP_00135 [Microbacterium sp. NPDC077663]|uniref:hypothetical protein n=1 Tax=Microbacterium sp. NPDC077663 TaxID=3364189 RepID=UPI0037C5DDA3